MTKAKIGIIATCVIAFIAVVFVRHWHKHHHAPIPQKPLTAETKAMIADKALSIIAGATRVEAFRISWNDPPTANQRTIAGCPIIGDSTTLTSAFTTHLKQTLLNDTTYEGPKWSCSPQYGVLFRLWKDKDSADVLLCYHCGLMEIDTNTSSGTKRQIIGGSWDLVRPEFVDLAKEAFPKDHEIQSLTYEKAAIEAL